MKEIKRYGSGLSGQIIETKQGSFVDYDDHTAIVGELQEQLQRYSMSAGQADQRKAESDAVREALGLSADANDVAPCDLVDAIAALQEQARGLTAEADRMKSAIKQVFPFGVEDEKGKIGFSGIAKECYASALETPTTDAALREIRAHAMDEAAEEVDEWVGNDLLAQELRKKSASIRAGEQP